MTNAWTGGWASYHRANRGMLAATLCHITAMPTIRFFPCQRSAVLALLVLCASAHGQTVYRTQGANGQAVFSDRPSVDAKTVPLRSNASPDATLPYDLQQVMQRYPLVLYTTRECAPCGEARGWLMKRGLPFAERQINTPEDQLAFQPQGSSIRMPQLRVGEQVLTGFEKQNWGRYIAAAGYPDVVKLPAGYKRPDPAPLTNSAAPISATRPDELPDANAVPPAIPPARSPDNPSGIRF